MPISYDLEVALARAWEKLFCKNFEEMPSHKGATWNKEKRLLSLPVLNNVLQINYQGMTITTTGGEPVEPHLQVLTIHYLAGPAVTLKGEWLSFKELPGGFIYQQPFYGRAILPLINAFGHNPASLIRTGQALAGKPVKHGDAAIELYPFPFLPVRLIIWAGDQELSPGGTILFNASAPEMLATEDFAVLAEYLVNRLKSFLKSGNSY